MSMLTHDPAVSFGNAFDIKFQALTRNLSHNEIPLFRATHKALSSLGGSFDIEEYHGSSHQVKFSGDGSYARADARCELSDLMIVAYSLIARSTRLTYLQAKSERAVLSSVCAHKFSANLEQWYLLSSRPRIVGLGNFNPPPDLLSGALLPSVGSFGFFYKDIAGDFQIYYATASHLVPPGSYSRRHGKVQALGACGLVTTAGYTECIAACGNRSFAESLYRLQIGTPVDAAISQTMGTRNWLAEILRKRIEESQQSNSPSRLAQELLSLLASDVDQHESGSFGAKYLIIIKSDIGSNSRS